MGKKSGTFASASGNSRSGYKLVKNSAFINVDLPRPDSPEKRLIIGPPKIFVQNSRVTGRKIGQKCHRLEKVRGYL